jgi:parvulin-like peptidyl-prolyl isomerase
MRTYSIIMVFCVVFGFILSGCTAKERLYGEFTEEEIAEMGYAKVDGLPPASGGVTLSIMGETVTSDEIIDNELLIKRLEPMTKYGIYEIFEKNARETVDIFIMNKVSDILIYQMAKKNAPPNIDEILEKSVESEVNQHVAVYGNDFAKAEEAFKEIGITSWDAFREHKKKLIMTQFYISKNVKKDIPIMHSDMLAMYNALKKKYFIQVGKLTMRVIEIDANKLTADEIDTANGETAEDAAVRKATGLVKQLRENADFAKLAKTHSHGAKRKKGGLWNEMTTASINEPYDVLGKAAESMEPGDVSGVIKAGEYVFIMKLEDKIVGKVTPFAEVQGILESRLKMSQQRAVYNKALADIVNHAEIRDLGVFSDYCIKRAYEVITNKKK